MIKKGQRVQINSGGKDYEGTYDRRTGVVTTHDGYNNTPYVLLDTGYGGYFTENYLTPVEPSIDNLMVGDWLELDLGDVGKSIQVSFIGNDDFVVLGTGKHMSKAILKQKGYKVFNSPPKPTMTIQEAEEKLNAIIIKE